MAALTTETTVLLASSAAATALGAVVSAWLVGRARRSMPTDADGRSAAFLRLHKQRVRVVAWTLLVQAAIALLGPWSRDMSIWAPVLLGSCLVWEVATAPAVLRLHSDVRGEGWSVRLVTAAHRWHLATTLGVPFFASVGVAFVAAIGPTRDPSGWAFNAHAAGVLVGVVVASSYFRRFGKLDALPESHVARLRATFGDDLPHLNVIRTGGSGMWNAYALGALRRRRRIVVSEDLVALLTPDELHAVLCHEMGHHRLRHVGFRTLLVLTAWLVPAGAAAAAGVLTPNVSAIGPILVLLPAGWLYRRQEREADAFAAQHAPAADLGAGLVKMTTAQMLPAGERLGGTHPALRERIAALGLPPAAPAAPAAVPS